MLFNSYIFIIFLAIVFPIYYILPSKKTKNLLLLGSSYFFYGYWDWRFCTLLAISTVWDFYVGGKLHASSTESKRKKWLISSVIVNLGILGIFKYFNFFIESFKEISLLFGANVDFLHLNIILPVGISFYTFQTMSYTIDIYKKKLEPSTSILDFAVFVSFFPQLVAGPIERAKHLLPQISRQNHPTKLQLKEGVELIVMGMFKKVLIGDTTGRLVDHLFGKMENYTGFELICALVLFSIQIYADFSGYSSIARGVSKLLGIELMINFNQPYLSANITEFWRRWHISLSSWLKDYLYITLGGNRKSEIRTYINLMLTMLLGGLWHGASWNFVIWGGLHGIYLAIHKLILQNKKVETNYVFTGITSFLIYSTKVFSTYLLILLTWLFFRVKDFSGIELFFSKLTNWEYSEHTLIFTQITLAFAFIIILLDTLEYFTGTHTYMQGIKRKSIKNGILFAVFMVVLLYMFQAKPLPFVYFQF